MAWRRDFGYGYFPRSVPRAAKGGIKAQSRQGGFGQTWWAKRWIAVLESFNIGARLGRGRSYARRGQVLSIQITPGIVTAEVQGSRPDPYDVEIKVKRLSKAESAKLGQALSEQAIFAAKLLAGEMPPDIEQAFASIGLSLFPERLEDLKTECSCPDWSNPCKHIAAVYYLLGEEFDRDPFLIFKLRGVDRDQLISILSGGPGEAAPVRKRKKSLPEPNEPVSASAEPISRAAADFWKGTVLPQGWLGNVRAPPLPAALLKRLGNFPFWRANQNFLEALTPCYNQASSLGRQVLCGETTG